MKGSVYNYQMCRSIKKLRDPEYFPDDEEIRAAALQYIRKVSGYRQPSRTNQVAFDDAVDEVATSTRTLLEKIQLNATGNNLPTPHQSDAES